jgi:hypothetical protein
MKTFIEFVEHKNLEKEIKKCAELMVEMDVNPTEYILRYVSNEPEAEKCLFEYIDFQEGIWDNVKDFAGRVGGAAKAIGGSIWNGGGLKHGISQAKDIMAGPASKFDTALRAMNDLANSLGKGYKDANGNVVSFNNIQSTGTTTAGGKISVVDYIKKLTALLEKESQNMPKLQAAQVSAPNMGPRGTP